MWLIFYPIASIVMQLYVSIVAAFALISCEVSSSPFPQILICASNRFGTFTVWVHEVNTQPKHFIHAVDGPGTERYDIQGATCSASGWMLDHYPQRS